MHELMTGERYVAPKTEKPPDKKQKATIEEIPEEEENGDTVQEVATKEEEEISKPAGNLIFCMSQKFLVKSGRGAFQDMIIQHMLFTNGKCTCNSVKLILLPRL